MMTTIITSTTARSRCPKVGSRPQSAGIGGAGGMNGAGVGLG